MPQLAGTVFVGSYIRPVSNGAALRLFGETSGHVGLAPAPDAGSTTFVLPATAGSNGQVLVTNGQGHLSWASIAEGVTQHAELSGLDQDDHPQYLLRSVLTSDGDLLTRSGGTEARLPVGTDNQVLRVASGVPTWTDVPSLSGGAVGNNGAIQFNDQGGFGASSTFVRDGASGHVGIGTSLPQASLHINDNDTRLILENPGQGLTNIWGISLVASASQEAAAFRAVGNTGEVMLGGVYGSYYLVLYSGNHPVLAFDTSGNGVFNYAVAMSQLIPNSTGSLQIGSNSAHALGFWGATPVTQPASAAQAALTDSTGGTVDGTVSAVSGSGDDATINNNFAEILQLLGAIRQALVDTGIIRGSN